MSGHSYFVEKLKNMGKKPCKLYCSYGTVSHTLKKFFWNYILQNRIIQILRLLPNVTRHKVENIAMSMLLKICNPLFVKKCHESKLNISPFQILQYWESRLPGNRETWKSDQNWKLSTSWKIYENPKVKSSFRMFAFLGSYFLWEGIRCYWNSEIGYIIICV